jgi:hypothetical protein
MLTPLDFKRHFTLGGHSFTAFAYDAGGYWHYYASCAEGTGQQFGPCTSFKALEEEIRRRRNG